MSKIEQLEKQLSDIQSEIEQLKGNQEFEEGQWVLANKGSEYFVKWTHKAHTIGFFEGNWKDCILFSANREYARPATTEEISEALIAEAKRRYSTGDELKPIGMNTGGIDGHIFKPRKFNYYTDDTLFCNENLLVYKKGDWAEIIEPAEEPIEINGYEAEFKEGYVQFGCAKIENSFFTDLAKCIHQEALDSESMVGNRVIEGVKIGNGLFTLDKIKKIAKRIDQ